ncbi:MAG: antibiotic biosynthesis monooxygenase [Bacteroidetes bacterium]|nr:antibiotic biosynthesis monooxygenase [Bacteroidota bacterium]
MIVRIWHGKTSTENAETYMNYVMQTGIKDYRATPGNLNAQVWQKQEGDITHIWSVSWWVNVESIKAFAGKNYEKAKYYAEDKKYLLELEPTVQHYECFGEIR